MPIYEYRCNACGHQLEVMQKLSDPELSECPSCDRPELRKLISAVSFRLKGGGWYETDFKSNDQKKNIAKDDGPPADASKPSGDSTGAVSSPTPKLTPTPAPATPAPATPAVD